MAELTKPSSGPAAWTNLVNNWFSSDTAWMEERMVIKWDTEAGIGTPSTVDGSLAYARDTQQLVLQAGATKRHLFASAFLGYSENSTQVTLKHSSAPTGLDLLSSGGVRLAGTILQADPTGVSIKVGTATALLSTDATDLISSLPVRASTFKGNLVGNVTGAVTGSLSGSQAGGSVSATTLAASGQTTLQNASAVDITAQTFIGASGVGARLWGSPTKTLGQGDVRLLGGPSRILLNDGSGLEVPVAGVITSGGAPTSEDYPDGTIWLQV